ncbi:hypothetical protein BH18ACT5_BH18ACT5_18480 [soil metagenome]
MEREPIDPSYLGPVVRAAMQVLNRLDKEEVPARIQKVAGRSGKLPRPLAVSLVAELDRNDWLRDKVLASSPDLDVESSRPGVAVSALFVLRPEGWRERISNLLASAPTPSSPAPDLPAELRRALLRIETLSGKVARLQSAQAQGHLELAKARKTAATAAPAQSSAPLRKRISELEGELAAMQTKYDASQARVKELLQRREKVEPSRGKRLSGTPGKALDLARQLDSQIATLRIPPSTLPPTPVAAEPPAPLALPAGVAPDRAESIDWVLGVPGKLALAIDGWNLAYLWRTPPGPRERNRVESALNKIGRLRRERTGETGRLLAVFDSSLDNQSVASRFPDVELFFPLSADQALIDLATNGVVVVSSDRLVREECERRGAVALWSEAVVDWVATRTT